MKLGSIDVAIQRGIAATVGPAGALNDAILAHVKGARDLEEALAHLDEIKWPARASAAYARAAFEEVFRCEMLGQLVVASKYGVIELVANSWVEMPIKDALAYFRKKHLALPEKLNALEKACKAQGERIRKDHGSYLQQQLRQSMQQSIKAGRSKADWVKEANGIFDSWGVTPKAKHHLEAVFDTSAFDAYGHGRLAQMTEQRMKKLRPFWRYRTAGDNRVRETHRAMQGWTAAVDAPVWDLWFPPNGFRCRCVVDSLRKAPNAREDMPSVMPDPGFESKPGRFLGS